MKYLIILLFIFVACSEDDEPLGYGCAQLRQDANSVCKRSIANPNDKVLAAECKKLADEVWRKRCP